jgi:dihydroorotase
VQSCDWHGAAHYGLKPNEGAITLEKRPWTPPAEVKVAGVDERAMIHHGGERLDWQVVG